MFFTSPMYLLLSLSYSRSSVSPIATLSRDIDGIKSRKAIAVSDFSSRGLSIMHRVYDMGSSGSVVS